MHNVSVETLADYIINYSCIIDKPVTNLYLNKILFIIQAEYYKEYNRLLFHDKFVNWEFGPVIENVYYKYSSYGSLPIQQIRSL